MAQYIDKSALVAELKKRISNYWSDSENTMGIYPYALEEVIKYVDALEVKEVDLEEKATQLSQKFFPDEENTWARPNIEAHKCKSACIEMVEWLKAQKGE